MEARSPIQRLRICCDSGVASSLQSIRRVDSPGGSGGRVARWFPGGFLSPPWAGPSATSAGPGRLATCQWAPTAYECDAKAANDLGPQQRVHTGKAQACQLRVSRRSFTVNRHAGWVFWFRRNRFAGSYCLLHLLQATVIGSIAGLDESGPLVHHERRQASGCKRVRGWRRQVGGSPKDPALPVCGVRPSHGRTP